MTSEQHPQGFVIWMTGLSAAGKSTLARQAQKILTEEEGRRVEILDGDEVRKGLSRDLGLSKEDREEHAWRVSFVAKLLSRNGVVVLVSLITPYRSSRAQAREMVGAERFLETYVRAPLELCEKRDPKGLYAKALRGEISNFTGIQDPYEEPESPDILVDTSKATPEQSARALVDDLKRLGRLPR